MINFKKSIIYSILTSFMLILSPTQASYPIKRNALEAGIDRTTERRCPICYQVISPGESQIKLNCGHIYHGSCIRNWVNEPIFEGYDEAIKSITNGQARTTMIIRKGPSRIKYHTTCPECREFIDEPLLRRLNPRISTSYTIIEKEIPTKKISVFIGHPRGFSLAKKELETKMLAHPEYSLEISLKEDIQEIPEDFFDNLSNLKKISFKGEGLIKLPFIAYNLSELEIANSKITTIQGSFPNLEKLRFSNNNIKLIKGDFPNLLNIHTAFNNKIEKIEGNFPKLEVLDLKRQKLKEVNGNFPALKFLELNGNQLEKLEGAFPKLIEANLGGNKFTCFPEALTNCHDLKSIQLHYNKIKNISNNIKKLINLRKLELSQNEIESFDHELQDLEILNLGYNKIKNFNAILPKIKTLDLETNLLSSFNGDYPELIKLELRNNKELEILEGSFPNLEVLDIQSCNLKSLPESITKSPNLKQLIALGNKLESFEGNLPKAIRINLTANKIKDFKGSFPLVENINLSSNNLESFNIDLPNVIHLDLSHNKLPQISISAPNLETLSLGYNKFTNFKLEDNFKKPLPDISFLDLAGNQLTKFNENLPNLYHLNLWNNKNLKEISGDLPKLRELRIPKGNINLSEELINNKDLKKS